MHERPAPLELRTAGQVHQIASRLTENLPEPVDVDHWLHRLHQPSLPRTREKVLMFAIGFLIVALAAAAMFTTGSCLADLMDIR